LFAIAPTWSAFFGVTSKAGGSGLLTRFFVRSGYFFFIRASASCFEMKTTVFVWGKERSFALTSLICCVVGLSTKKTLTSTSLRT
jgi:hypothetical protein